MRIIYHPSIQKDVWDALSYYTSEGGEKLGDRFFEAVEATVKDVALNPQGFQFAAPTLRRAFVKRFPYHFLYEDRVDYVRFMVLRHDRRHPNFGMRRH